MNLYPDIVKLICLTLSDIDKLALLSTCTTLYKIRSEIIYTDPVKLEKIINLPWKNNFEFVQISNESNLDLSNISATKLIIMSCCFENINRLTTIVQHFIKIKCLCIRYCSCYNISDHSLVWNKIFTTTVEYIFDRCQNIIELETEFVPLNSSLNKLSKNLTTLKISDRTYENGCEWYNKDEIKGIHTIIPLSVINLELNNYVHINSIPTNLQILRSKFFICEQDILSDKLKCFEFNIEWPYRIKIPHNVTDLVIENYDSDYLIFYYDIPTSVNTIILKNIKYMSVHDNFWLKYLMLPLVHTLKIYGKTDVVEQSIPDLVLTDKSTIKQNFISNMHPSIKKLCLYINLDNHICIPDHVEIIRTYASNREYILAPKRLVLYDYAKY